MEKEEIIYQEVLSITKELKKRERKTAAYIYIGSLVFLSLFKVSGGLNILLLVSVALFGIATSILFRRNLDIKLGGMCTYSLLLYYSLSNAWLPVHFLAVTLLGVPVGVYFIRKGYIGQTLFYILSLVIFPVTVLSYYVLTTHFLQYSLISSTYHAGDVVYLLLPQIYLYSTLQLRRGKIFHDIMFMVLLLLLGLVIWVSLLRLIM